MSTRKYREKIEVLRDVLAAAKYGYKKTRIIGLANLNPASFDKYVAFCIDHDLLVSRNGGYELTARAEQTLCVIDLVLAKASELHEALEEFARVAGDHRPGSGDSSTFLHLFPHLVDHPYPPLTTNGPLAHMSLGSVETRRRR